MTDSIDRDLALAFTVATLHALRDPDDTDDLARLVLRIIEMVGGDPRVATSAAVVFSAHILNQAMPNGAAEQALQDALFEGGPPEN